MTGTGGAGGTVGGGSGGVTPPVPGDDVAGPAPLRRLTIAEFNNTVRDLLGAETPVITSSDGFASDLEAYTRGFLQGATVGSANDARLYMTLSDKIATAVMPRLASLMPSGCAAPAASGEMACAKQFIEQFGLRAYRRPLTTEEQGDLLTLYTTVRAPAIGLTFAEGIRTLIAGILQSPMFSYRWELGGDPIQDGPLVRLNDYEIASRLSYLTLASMPDAQLFAAAAAGDLTDPEKIATQARRLLASDKAKIGLSEFIVQWLGASSLPTLAKDESFTTYTPAVGESMLKESGLFFAGIMQGTTGKLEEFYTSSTSYLDAPLAKLYGVTGVTGAQMRPVPLNPAQRAGILTQGSYLASQAEGDHPHPIHRGLQVLEKVLCNPIPPPANFVPPPVKDVMPGVPNRKRYEDSTSASASCSTCHTTINGLGFAFENFDAVGGWRDMDAGLPVNASGTVAIDDHDVTFKNAMDLTKAIAKSDQARTCFAKQFLEYTLRRHVLDEGGEKGSIAAIAEAFNKSGYDLRELFVATTKTTAFTHRQPLAGEGQQ